MLKNIRLIKLWSYCGKLSGSRHFSSAPVTQAKIGGLPDRCLIDEKLSIQISELEPNQEYCLHLGMTNDLNLSYDSFTSFNSDGQGVIDLDKHAPTCQTYTKIIDSMGIFRSLKYREGFRERIWSEDITKPLRCPQHLSRKQCEDIEGCRSSQSFKNCNF